MPAAVSVQGGSAQVDAIDAVLPQTQCTRCGFPDCRSYAQAIAQGAADIDRCPPGGAQGIERLAAVTGRAVRPLDAECGIEGPRRLAVIDEAWCIGCTLCLKACPVDAIVGAARQMHTVIDALCTGCDLCLPVCPVDCIDMVDVSGPRTGWDAWSEGQAATARQRHAWHRHREDRERREDDERLAARAAAKVADLQAHPRSDGDEALRRKRAVVEAALVRAAARKAD